MKLKFYHIAAIIVAAGSIGYLFELSSSNGAVSPTNNSIAASQKKGKDKMSSATIITASNFDSEVLQSKDPVLVDFWAPWCGPCRILGPTIDQLAEDYKGKAKIVKVNVDENQALAARYGVRGIPTVILFKNGEPVDRSVGLQSKQNLSEKLDNAIKQ